MTNPAQALPEPPQPPGQHPATPPFATLRDAIDQALRSFLAERRRAMATLAPASAHLVDLVSEVVGSGGKRLRPSLCYCAHQAAGGEHGGQILHAAASLELLHTFAILHDDVMDQALLRRGQPALHRRLAQERRAAGHPVDADTFGLSAAVLAGDLALVLSDAMLASSGFAPEALARAAGPLEDMRARAIAGQYLDLVHAGTGPVSAAQAERIGALKTAGYSVVGPLAVGAALAGAPVALREALAGYGTALGEAFSLRDEVLGLFGDAASTGKDAESDLRRGKPTSLLADALERAGGTERQVLVDHWGDPLASSADLAAVRRVVRASGALQAHEARIEALVAQGLACLAATGVLEGPAGAAFDALARAVSNPPT